jgi:hypothetical protein
VTSRPRTGTKSRDATPSAIVAAVAVASAHGGGAARCESASNAELYERAATALLNADYVLVCAGAGFSADSGLPVYKDVADTPAYRAMGVTYGDLCTPQWARQDPEIFFGFWFSCFNKYHAAHPHPGYATIRRWCSDVVGQKLLKQSVPASASASSARPPPSATARPSATAARPPSAPRRPPPRPASAACDRAAAEGSDSEGDDEEALPAAAAAAAAAAPSSFVFTSNVDCFFRRAGFAEQQLLEIHGNVQRWQCSIPCAASRAAAMPVWQIPPSRVYEVDEVTMRAPNRRSVPQQEPAAGSEAGEAAREAGGGSTHGTPRELPPHEAMGERNHERCRFCGRPARPCILMFDDNAWIGDAAPGPLGPGHSQARSYRAWEAAVKRELKADRRKRLVILEAGCGLRVPTVRKHSEKLLRQTGKLGTTLIRINPDRPDNKKNPAATISIRDTCLGAISRIDAAIAAACAKRGVPPPPAGTEG